MVADPKDAFAQRLQQALNAMGWLHQRGVNKRIATALGLRSGEAVRKWMVGLSMPSMEHASALAKMLNVSVQWLMTGQGEAKIVESATNAIGEHQDRYHLPITQLPIAALLGELSRRINHASSDCREDAVHLICRFLASHDSNRSRLRALEQLLQPQGDEVNARS